MLRSTILAATFITGILFSNQPLSASYDVDQIAYPGKPYDEKLLETQPEGIARLVNDPLRTVGSNSCFSDHPAHRDTFEFEISDMRELNRLIDLLSQVDGPKRIVHLSSTRPISPLRGFNPDPQSPGPPVILTIEKQHALDFWYHRVSPDKFRQVFGPSAIHHPPVAQPPTLTVYIQHPLVDLDQLTIPENISLQVDRSRNAVTPTAYFTSSDPITSYNHIFWSPAYRKQDPKSVRAAEQIKEFLSR